MGEHEKSALLELEQWCKTSAPNIKSIMLDMHLNRIERARVTDGLEASQNPNVTTISFEELFSMVDFSEVENKIFDILPQLKELQKMDLDEQIDKLYGYFKSIDT